MYESTLRLGAISSPLRGLNDRLHPSILPGEFTPSVKDMIYRNGWCEQRRGLRQVNASPITGSDYVLSQGAYYRSGVSTLRQHLIHSNNRIYRRTAGTITTEVVPRVISSEPMRYASGLNVMLMTNGEQPPILWNGTTAVDLVNAPRGRYPFYYNDYFFIGFLTEFANGRSLIRNSELRDESTWDATDVWNIETHDGEDIRAINQEGPYLVIFKESSRTLIRGNFFDQSLSAFDAQKVSVLRGVGALSHEGIVRVGNELYVPDREGIYRLRSGDVVDLVTKEIPEWWSQVNFNTADQIHGVHWPEMRWMLWTLPRNGAGTPNWILVYDYQNKGLWPWEVNARSMIDFVEDDGIRHIYIGSADGILYDLYQTDSDDGTAIDSHVEWPEAGRQTRSQHSLWEQLRIIAKNAGSNVITVRTWADGRHTSEQSTTFAQSEGVSGQETENEQVVAIAHQGRTLQTRFQNSTDSAHWGIREVLPMGRPVGVTR